jgi:hypothetical protein
VAAIRPADALLLGETATYGRAADDRAACEVTSGPAAPGQRADGDPGLMRRSNRPVSKVT